MMGTGAALITLLPTLFFLDAGYGKILMAEAERLLSSIGCPKINFCVRIDNDKVVEFFYQPGYAIQPVHLLGKHLIEDD